MSLAETPPPEKREDIPIEAQPKSQAQSPAPIIRVLTTPLTIDCACLNEIGAHLKVVLGDIEFRARSWVATHHGISAEEATAKEKFGTTYAEEIYVMQRGGSHGVYFEVKSGTPVRILLPGDSGDTLEKIRATLKRYKSHHSWFSDQPPWTYPILFLLLPYLSGALIGFLANNPGYLFEKVKSLLRGESGTPSGTGAPIVPPSPAPAFPPPPTPSMPPIPGPSRPGLGVTDIIVQFVLGAALVAIGVILASQIQRILNVIGWPFSFLTRAVFPRLTLDVPCNQSHNTILAKWRWALITVPASALMKGLFR